MLNEKKMMMQEYRLEGANTTQFDVCDKYQNSCSTGSRP